MLKRPFSCLIVKNKPLPRHSNIKLNSPHKCHYVLLNAISIHFLKVILTVKNRKAIYLNWCLNNPMVWWSYLAILAGAERTDGEFLLWRPWKFRDFRSVNVLLLKNYLHQSIWNLLFVLSNHTCSQSVWFLCLFVIKNKRIGKEHESLLKKS